MRETRISLYSFLLSEYWPGWFDHWFAPIHIILSLESFESILQEIFDYEGSVNFYMFHGGTNFGFMNGANVLDVWPFYGNTVTSYDYDAPLTGKTRTELHFAPLILQTL